MVGIQGLASSEQARKVTDLEEGEEVGDGGAEDGEQWESEGKLQRHSCLTLVDGTGSGSLLEPYAHFHL